ncbi:hypothetical protein GWO43_21020 [candidate division KSB1 bacterium]|nr:hypothetical protein [candidate division KSB1 bacterium]NIS26548.1 hypothetical protein [candidate division KSB1 bacterium]NIT73311.1 hypothetical protein [candidate division KSB1 bacterium]NIU23934.1 hypothetical protein [candidate division KSB1 bacterium]NIU91288.1 hypothetical protein [candidate division KSB1 bacterium]
MRLPESKIKQGILHPEAKVRYTAVGYFSESYSRDPSVMPLVIEAVEKYGWKGAYYLIGHASSLAQTEDTLRWIFHELNREIDKNDMDQVNYLYNLGRMLYRTDPGLLLRHETDIIECRGLFKGVSQSIAERIEMLS